ncbi:hypothetical protein [Nocardia salmonicida]|uniref:hypothetical protein n=1 Tax=Nocardia salmonicida TaxID=53431 RepID=UPI0037964F72
MRLRGLVVAAAVMLGLTACQGDPPETTRVAEPAPTTTLPPVDASYWSTVPQTDEQRAEVSARARLIDVCALVPRAELVTLGEVRNVDNDETDSCRVELGPSDSVEKLSWASMVVFGDAAPPGASGQQLGGRTAHIVDGTSYTVVVGPEFAGETSYFGASAPAVNVFADTPAVAEDVMRHVLTLFPAT